MLRRKEASGENYEAAHSMRIVDPDQYPPRPPLKEMCGKEPCADQRLTNDTRQPNENKRRQT